MRRREKPRIAVGNLQIFIKIYFQTPDGAVPREVRIPRGAAARSAEDVRRLDGRNFLV